MKKVLALILVLLVIGGGAYAWLHHINNNGNSGTSTVNNDPKLIDSASPVAVLRDYVPKKYTSLTTLAGNTGIVAYKVDNYAYTSLIPLEGQAESGAIFTAKTKANTGNVTTLPTSFRTDVASKLAVKGYHKTASKADAKALLSSTTDYDYFANDTDGICVLSSSQTNQYAAFLCTTTSVITSAASAAQPFAASLATTQNTTQDKLGIGTPQIATNTRNNQYEHAMVQFSAPSSSSAQSPTNEQASAYFYRPANTRTDWIFYKTSQEGLSCADTSANTTANTAFSDICNSQGF